MILKLLSCFGLICAIAFGSPHSIVLNFHAGADCTVQSGKGPCPSVGNTDCKKKILFCNQGDVNALTCTDSGGEADEGCRIDLDCAVGTHASIDDDCTPVVNIAEDGPIGP